MFSNTVKGNIFPPPLVSQLIIYGWVFRGNFFLNSSCFYFSHPVKKKKKKKGAAELYYVIFTPSQDLAPVPTKLGEAKRTNLISRFWRDSISPGFIFAISTDKYIQGELNFAIQVFSTSL